MNFKKKLKKENFFLCECPKCKKIVWPHSEFCDMCFTKTNLKKSSGIGKIIEFSKQNEKYFCVAEIEESIRLMGEISSGIPEINKKIKIVEGGILDEDYKFKMKVLD